MDASISELSKDFLLYVSGSVVGLATLAAGLRSIYFLKRDHGLTSKVAKSMAIYAAMMSTNLFSISYTLVWNDAPQVDLSEMLAGLKGVLSSRPFLFSAATAFILALSAAAAAWLRERRSQQRLARGKSSVA